MPRSSKANTPDWPVFCLCSFFSIRCFFFRGIVAVEYEKLADRVNRPLFFFCFFYDSRFSNRLDGGNFSNIEKVDPAVDSNRLKQTFQQWKHESMIAYKNTLTKIKINHGISNRHGLMEFDWLALWQMRRWASGRSRRTWWSARTRRPCWTAPLRPDGASSGVATASSSTWPATPDGASICFPLFFLLGTLKIDCVPSDFTIPWFWRVHDCFFSISWTSTWLEMVGWFGFLVLHVSL